jgi:hypothetical protein
MNLNIIEKDILNDLRKVVLEFLSDLKEGDHQYYRQKKRELSFICGFDAVNYNQELFDMAMTIMIKIIKEAK